MNILLEHCISSNSKGNNITITEQLWIPNEKYLQ